MKIKDIITEAPLADYVPQNMEVGKRFSDVDKRLIQHPVTKMKAERFFEKTPYDFRLFFNGAPGLKKYQESGEHSPDQITMIFGKDAEAILKDHEDAITVVFVGNWGDRKVMLTPWIMAHRFGHAIYADSLKDYNSITGTKKWSAWAEAEKHFYTMINNILEEYYGKSWRRYGAKPSDLNYDLTPEYNALFNAIGTQRSSRTGQIKRPGEFMYEILAQYLGTGKIEFNELPTSLGYGQRAWGRPTKYMNINPEMRNSQERRYAAETLARDMEFMFSDVLSNSVGKIFIM